jgi:hypothetical protein
MTWFTVLLNSRYSANVVGRLYPKAIFPIWLLYAVSLFCFAITLCDSLPV